MLDLVENTISRYNMIPRGAALGLAVSGGADSVFLLHALHALAPNWQASLCLVHIDHALRGGESDADREFVEELARRFSLPFHCLRMPLVPPSENLEQYCRRFRHEYFARLMREAGLSRIATGHTASDQAETVLMRLLRGSSPAGLRGVVPVTAEGLIRPLIHLDREAVRAYLSGRGIPWREDSSNFSARFLRNRVRSRILPSLRAEQPRIDNALTRLASAASRDEHYWSLQVDQMLRSAAQATPFGLQLDVTALQQLHPALLYRVLHAAASHARGSSTRITQSHLDALSGLLGPGIGTGSVRLPGLFATRSHRLLLLHLEPLSTASPPGVAFPVPGSTPFGPHFVDAVVGTAVHSDPERPLRPSLLPVVSQPPGLQAYTKKEWNSLDWERIRGPLALRSFRPGDRFHPAGLPSGLPLKNLFQKARIPLWERRVWPIITDDDRIVWIAGFGPAATLVAGPDTAVRLHLRWRLPCPPDDSGDINFCKL